MRFIGNQYIENSMNNSDEYPYEPLSGEEIYAELAESRACYDRGEYQDFDEAINEISKECIGDDGSEN